MKSNCSLTTFFSSPTSFNSLGYRRPYMDQYKTKLDHVMCITFIDWIGLGMHAWESSGTFSIQKWAHHIVYRDLILGGVLKERYTMYTIYGPESSSSFWTDSPPSLMLRQPLSPQHMNPGVKSDGMSMAQIYIIIKQQICTIDENKGFKTSIYINKKLVCDIHSSVPFGVV